MLSYSGLNRKYVFCKTGKDEPCTFPGIQCNCDTMRTATQTDVGNGTEKSLLPITGYGYGPSIAIDISNSKANVTIGPLVCSGNTRHSDTNK